MQHVCQGFGLRSSRTIRTRAFAGTLAALLAACVPGVARAQADAPAQAAPESPPAAEQQTDPRWDPATGRNLANYPHPRHFDHRHLALNITIPDMNQPRWSATASIRLAAIGRSRDRLVLDAVSGRAGTMTIRGVRVAGTATEFSHDGEDLVIPLAPARQPDAEFTVEIDYDLEYPDANGNGVTWTAGTPDAPSPTDRVPQLHTQGQPEFASSWFPCHDFPNERMTTETIVTVADGFTVSSNGRLVSRARASTPGFTTWHFLLDRPHPAYLSSLIIGKFELVGIDNAERPGLAFPVYAPMGSAAKVRETFKDTPAMTAFLERYLDEPYPWTSSGKYAQLIVRNFRWGGMENTTVTTLYRRAAEAEPGSLDGLIMHELAHQWLGNMITCKSWEHAWLNEGWATFSESLWAGEVARRSAEPGADPEKAARRAYLDTIYDSMKQELAFADLSAPLHPAVASRLYPEGDADERFTARDNIYSKGASILHMLKSRLGDELFLQGVRLYVDRFAFREVETDDFRFVMEEVSGQSLERFFDQWTKRPGHPRLKVSYELPEPGSLKITVEQTQPINADNPAYAFTLPVYVKFAEGSTPRGTWVYIDTDQRVASATVAITAEPVDLDVDPAYTVLAAHTVKKPMGMWIEQLYRGETVISQRRAVEHLAASRDPEAIRALRLAATDDALPPSVRSAAAAESAVSMIREQIARWNVLELAGR